MTSGTIISKLSFENSLTALDANVSGSAVFVGSDAGIMRVFDVSSRSFPRLLKIFNFFSGSPISSIKCSKDGKYVSVTSKFSHEIILISQDPSRDFEFIGWAEVQGNVVNTDFQTEGGQDKLLAVLDNSFYIAINISLNPGNQRKMDSMSDDITKLMYRKTDKGMS